MQGAGIFVYFWQFWPGEGLLPDGDGVAGESVTVCSSANVESVAESAAGSPGSAVSCAAPAGAALSIPVSAWLDESVDWVSWDWVAESVVAPASEVALASEEPPST